MEARNVVDRVRLVIEPVLKTADLEVIDVEYKREPVGMVLRIFIDGPLGVDLETCATASALVSRALDENNELKSSYTLEVSSPGVERRLTKPEHFKRFVGETVVVKTFEPIDKRKRFRGILTGSNDSGFTIDIDGQVKEFAYSKTAKVNLVFCDW